MKVYGFRYSPYVRKVETVLRLLGRPYEFVEVPYSDRAELVAVTGGYVQVPVLVDGDGTVVVDSRRICQHLLRGAVGARLVPAAQGGPIWAYADWCDGMLEDVLFRLAAPGIRLTFPRPADQALYTFIKERKFGPGCIEAWKRDRAELVPRGRELLEASAETLKRRPFLFGDEPTLADAALEGEFWMLAAADPLLPQEMGSVFVDWRERLDAHLTRPTT
jgi:glutathione S-transferase